MSAYEILLLILPVLIKPSESVCNDTETFIKVSEVRPPTNSTVLVFSSPGDTVTEQCQESCIASSNCPGFLVNYDEASCFRVLGNENNFQRLTDSSTSANYFQKTCLKVPENCSSKVWTLERADGFELLDFSRTVRPNVESGRQCAQLCLTETQFACRSAMYYSDRRECSLNTEDRRTQPNSFRAVDWSIQYWENQCAPTVFPVTSCSLEEYSNSTMCCADSKFQNISQVQCQEKCNNESSFNCRGFTFIPSRSSREQSVCFLHGDDTSSVGPRGIQSLAGATYWERVPCLNLQVMCSYSTMTVVLHSKSFSGRVYVQGRSEKCNTQGRQGRDAVLKIPLWREGRVANECGVMVARSIGESNRTLISTVVIVQQNPIIQRRGDRAVKVGCLLDSSSPKNMTLGISLSFGGPDGVTNGGTVVVNTSAVPPTVSVRLVDRNREDEELKEVELGQSLELRIEVTPDNSSYDIHVFDLVATSGDGTQSYFLLDQRGCPSDPLTFPALRRLRPGSRSLVGDFRAFKFPRSDVVRFSGTVHFCPDTCPPVDCGGGVVSYGRRRRRQAVPPGSVFQELPLQLAIVVRAPGGDSSTIREYERNDSLILYREEFPDEVCMSWGILLGVALAWIILQFVIVAIWFVVFHWRRKPKLQDEHKLQDDFSDYDHRHVHWADQDLRVES